MPSGLVFYSRNIPYRRDITNTYVYFQIPDRLKIELVHTLAVGGGEEHPILTSVFMDAAMEAIDIGSHVSV